MRYSFTLKSILHLSRSEKLILDTRHVTVLLSSCRVNHSKSLVIQITNFMFNSSSAFRVHRLTFSFFSTQHKYRECDKFEQTKLAREPPTSGITFMFLMSNQPYRLRLFYFKQIWYETLRSFAIKSGFSGLRKSNNVLQPTRLHSGSRSSVVWMENLFAFTKTQIASLRELNWLVRIWCLRQRLLLWCTTIEELNLVRLHFNSRGKSDNESTNWSTYSVIWFSRKRCNVTFTGLSRAGVTWV